MPTYYTVKLVHQIAGLSAEEREVVEEAFCDCLEFALGGKEAVAPAWRAWQVARCTSDPAQAGNPSAEELAAIARWQTAEADATYFALKPFGPDAGDAHFEISVG